MPDARINARSQFTMLWYRKTRGISWLDQNDVASMLASFIHPAFWKALTARSPETEGRDGI